MEEVEGKNNVPFADAKLGFLLAASIFERTRYWPGNSVATNAPRGACRSKPTKIRNFTPPQRSREAGRGT